ncbi:type I pullulanase [Bacillus sp. 165]|nr:type I pullulanase [Bacillus sp. 165]MBO9130384.1 type I pullulanase [Bacillus sp. 165]
MAVQRDINYTISFGDPAVVDGLSVHSKEFDETFYYEGTLGITYEKEKTKFRLWAPTASEAKVVLYKKWDDEASSEHVMTRAEKGTWTLVLYEDLEGLYYTYKVKIGSEWNEAADPYAKAVGVNGDRGYILNLETTHPKHWMKDKPHFTEPTDAILYELHVRDLSMHPESGMCHKGKFLALTEVGTTGPNEIPTGIDHIKSLGVTHVQLLPIFDYSTDSVDETCLEKEQYNWGYDPKNYNAPEGSYSTDPYNPISRIMELKQTIQTLHDNGLRVVMDVVYNHVYDAYRMNFMKLVPGYYFRYKDEQTLSNGSACGNDVASERHMVRKFIIDSVKYWASEYNLDGFRFDLMGLHDVDTMNEIRAELDKIDPSILIIGEGWDLATELCSESKANQKNAQKMPRIAHFNDVIRDGLKGSVFYHEVLGLVNGNPKALIDVQSGIAGAIRYSDTIHSFADEPNQAVTYVEAHDNHTLWDKLLITNPNDTVETIKKMHKLCTAIVLTSQGIAFLHAGQEFMRTKGGDENSYKSSTKINQLDWVRCAAFQEEVDYVRRLIALRKTEPAFRLQTADKIRQCLQFIAAPDGVLAYSIRDEQNNKQLFVAHNTNRQAASVTLSTNQEWTVLFGQEHIINHTNTLSIAAFGSVVLSQ